MKGSRAQQPASSPWQQPRPGRSMRKRGRRSAPHRCMQRPMLRSRMPGVTSSRVPNTPAVRSPSSSSPQLTDSSLVTRETSRIHGITLPLRFCERQCPTELASCGTQPTIGRGLMSMMRRPPSEVESLRGLPASATRVFPTLAGKCFSVYRYKVIQNVCLLPGESRVSEYANLAGRCQLGRPHPPRCYQKDCRGITKVQFP